MLLYRRHCHLVRGRGRGRGRVRDKVRVRVSATEKCSSIVGKVIVFRW